MTKNIKFSQILFFFVPISFLIGPLILEFLLITIVASFLVDIYKKNNFKIFKNLFIYIIGTFSIYLIITMLIFSRFGDGYLYSCLYFRYALYVLAIYYYIKSEKKLFNSILISFVFINIILIIDAVFQNNLGFNLIGMPKIDLYRISSFFGSELILGSFILKISPIVFSFILINQKFSKKILTALIVLLMIINLYVISLSGERSALFMYVSYLIFLLIFLKFNVYTKIIFIFLFLSSLSSILYLNENVSERIIKKTYFEITGNSISDKKNPYKTEEYFELENLPFYIFSAAHTNYYSTSIKIYKDHKLFGSGPKSYRYLCKNKQYSFGKYSCSSHPHNYYIQLLSETGLIGISFLILAYSSLLVLLYKSVFSKQTDIMNKNFSIILIGGLLINFFPIMPTGNFFNNWNSILILMPISFLLKVYNDRK